MKKVINLIGQRFGRLIVIEFIGRRKGHSIFKCQCDCDGFTETTSNNLRRGHTLSCGCLSNEVLIERSITHGLSHHPLYNIWVGMRNRCYYHKHNRSKIYAGKGIIVCEEWKNDFKAFYDWAIANGWQQGLTIDRMENSGNYTPKNCRFRTPQQQSRNRTTNVNLTYKGQTMILIEWAEKYNICYGTLRKRVKNGWNPHECLFGRPKVK